MAGSADGTVRGGEPGPVRFAQTEISPEAVAAVTRVLQSGWVTTGPEVAGFEDEVAAYVGAGHAAAVASCTAGLELALRALELPAGSKVLTSTITFCGAVHAIVHAGLRPVLADVDPVTLMPDESATAEAAGRAGGVDAMVVMHYAGHPAPVAALAAAAGLTLDRVVEDAAHAFGTRVGGRLVGSISAAAVFSFYATKNLPIGEGGMVTTDDARIDDYVRRARLHGMSRDAWKRYLPGSSWAYEVDVAGLKANMTDVQAAVGRAQLKHFDRWQQHRRALARRYDDALSGLPGVQPAPWPEYGEHAWHLYVIQVEPAAFGCTRNELIEGLAARGIGTSVHFIPNHHHPYFRRVLGVSSQDPAWAERFPQADAAFERFVSLPMHTALRTDEVARVCAAIAEIGAEGRAGTDLAHDPAEAAAR